MKTDRIDFISSYCDSWCERCAFTSRCSAFAVTAAVAMCGDAAEGLELAIGAPREPDEDRGDERTSWLQEIENVEMTPNERVEFERIEEERDARIAASPISQTAHRVATLAHRWLTERDEDLSARANSLLHEALLVALRDAVLIAVKLDRALDGRDRRRHGECDDHPVQNDWNGSAKVALISIERSEEAWRMIAHATAQDTPADIARELHDLHVQVEQEFPDAWSFIRPGFDEPGR